MEHIINDINPGGQTTNDKASWMASLDGTFTVKSTYDLLRSNRRIVAGPTTSGLKDCETKLLSSYEGHS